MDLQVHIEAHVDIMLGLGVFATVKGFFPGLEVYMNQLSAFFILVIASVWGGVAFLRSLVKTLQPKRMMGKSGQVFPAKSEGWRFDSSPPHHFP